MHPLKTAKQIFQEAGRYPAGVKLEDLKEERRREERCGERCIAAGFLGEIRFDVPATAKRERAVERKDSPEARDCRKQIIRSSSASCQPGDLHPC